MEMLFDENILLKELEGTISDDEKELLNTWLTQSEENREWYNEFRNTWEITNRFNNIKRIDTAKALKKVKAQIPEFKKRMSFIQRYNRIAAVLFIPMLFFSVWLYLYQNSKPQSAIYKEISTSYGIKHKFNLPDGTIVWLNSGSVIKYPEKFAINKREIFLQGEAFFDVAKDPSRPFYVNLGKLIVKATGTKFNVTAYPEEDIYETSLLSGKVELVKKDENNSEIVVCKMLPKQLAIYNKTKENIRLIDESDDKIEKTSESEVANNIKLSSGIIEHNKHTSWIVSKLVFRNDPMEEVIKRLGRWYNVNIILEDTLLYDYKYTATFIDETLEQVLELLTLSAPIEYNIISPKIIDADTHNKKIVKIRLRKFK